MSKKHKDERPKCIRCNHAGISFNESMSFTKPSFKCNSCGNTWCYGYDGGEYAEHVQNPIELQAWLRLPAEIRMIGK